MRHDEYKNLMAFRNGITDFPVRNNQFCLREVGARSGIQMVSFVNDSNIQVKSCITRTPFGHCRRATPIIRNAGAQSKNTTNMDWLNALATGRTPLF
jgi:hypothetical protein